MKQLVLVGKVVGIYGVKGVLKLNFFIDVFFMRKLPDYFLMKIPGYSKLVKIYIISVRLYKKKFFLKIDNVSNYNISELFLGSKIYLNRLCFFSKNRINYFHSDLIGMLVKNIYGRIFGILNYIMPICTSVSNNDIYVIKDFIFKDDDVLIPAIKSVVIKINLERRVLIVNLQN